MKRLMVVTALTALAWMPLGCGKAPPDRATSSASPGSGSTARPDPAVPSAEVHPAPGVGQAPNTLPMTATTPVGERGPSGQIGLKAPPVTSGAPREGASQPLAAEGPTLQLNDPRDGAPSAAPATTKAFPAAAADPPSAGAPRVASSAAGAPRSLRDRLGSGLSNSAAAAIDPKGFATVRVFYGTNRQSVSPPAFDWQNGAKHFLWPGVLGLVTVGFVVVRRFWRNGALRFAAVIGVMATLTWSIFSGYQLLRAYQAAARPGRHYGGDRGTLELGTCDVTIPPTHEIGELEKPKILKFEVREDVTKHVTLQMVEQVEPDGFFRELKDRVGLSPRKDAFVFVHGFNVSFDDAARRTAQIAYDLSFEGAPIFFSWPSQASALAYTVDGANAEWAASDIKDFLKQVAEQSGAEQIHLIAHSMGNRALTYALRAAASGPPEKRIKRKFNEIVLTAPDIDAEVFKTQIAPMVARMGQRVTLYASSHDQALQFSKKINGYPRAGDSGAGLVVVKGVDTIDVSAVDTSLLGHSYYGSSDTVLTDIWDLIKCAKSPDLREYLRPRDYTGGLKYWVFEPKQTAAASGDDALRR